MRKYISLERRWKLVWSVLIRNVQTSRFAPGDRVWYRASRNSPKQGPYIAVQGPSAQKYYLATIDDIRVFVLDGRVVDESELEEASF